MFPRTIDIEKEAFAGLEEGFDCFFVLWREHDLSAPACPVASVHGLDFSVFDDQVCLFVDADEVVGDLFLHLIQAVMASVRLHDAPPFVGVEKWNCSSIRSATESRD
ncbi:MAG TPA: hypothetical protein VN397_01540 [Candidatus Methylomirabilis sp.]|nr:hypothetical protein [Candidatus Methylomirabilis sp.]